MNRSPDPQLDFDYILVGGGLQSGLLALAITHHRPKASIAIVEREANLAGNHTWSFHESDIPLDCRDWVSPIIETRWDDYEVRVGGFHRQVGLAYCSTSSSHFASVIAERLTASSRRYQVMTRADAETVTATEVVLRDGRQFTARVVIDNRGPGIETSSAERQQAGFQKFWGFELSLPEDWPLPRATIMDDRVDQSDGFRFFYNLPFSPRRVLIEDTRFSDSPNLDRADCLRRVSEYLRRMTDDRVGMADCEIVREENGVLPMPWSGFRPQCPTVLDSTGSAIPLAGGYRGGWFHAATGYSFAMAVAFADCVARSPIDQLERRISDLARAHHHRGTFARFLNRLLFRLVSPPTRYQIFRRFYRVLPDARVARFYAHQFKFADAARIVIGIPPRGLRPFRFFKSFSVPARRDVPVPQAASSRSTSVVPPHSHLREAKP